MDQGRASASYAKALLDWAIDNNLAGDVYAQSHFLWNLINTNPDFYLLLHSPMTSITKKKLAIEHVLNSCSPLFSIFVSLMVKNHREKLLKSTLLVFQSLYRQRFNITMATVESANEMNHLAKQRVTEFLEKTFGGQIELVFQLKPEIIGGFVLIVNDQRLDKSVKGEIDKFRRKLIGIET